MERGVGREGGEMVSADVSEKEKEEDNMGIVHVIKYMQQANKPNTSYLLYDICTFYKIYIIYKVYTAYNFYKVSMIVYITLSLRCLPGVRHIGKVKYREGIVFYTKELVHTGLGLGNSDHQNLTLINRIMT